MLPPVPSSPRAPAPAISLSAAQGAPPFDVKGAKKTLERLKADYKKATSPPQKDALRMQIAQGYATLGDAYRDICRLDKAHKSYRAIQNYDTALYTQCLQKLPPVMPDLPDTPSISTEWRNRVTAIRHSLTQALTFTSSSPVPMKGPFFSASIAPTSPVLFKASAVEAVHHVQDILTLVASLNANQGDARSPFYDLAEKIIAQFADKPPSLERIRELVILATVSDHGLYQQIIEQLLNALREDRHSILYAEVAQGLAVIIEHPPEQLDLTRTPGIWVRTLQALQVSFSTLHVENNAKQLLPMLQAICSVLDAMVWNTVTGLARTEVCVPLQKALKRVKNHADVTVDFQGRYACQALAYLENESLGSSIARHSTHIGLGIGFTALAIWKLEPGKFLTAFEHFAKTTEIQPQFAWYKGLLYIDALLRVQDITRFERFVSTSKLAKDPSFLQGVSLRIEQLLLTQKEEGMRTGALHFLQSLAHPRQAKSVQHSAQAVLQRLQGMPTQAPSTISQLMRPSMYLAALGGTAQFLQTASFSHPTILPPVWEPIWYASGHQELLQHVQDKIHRAQALYSLSTVPQTVEAIALGMQQFGAVASDIQHLKNQLEVLTLQATTARNQPLVQLGDSIEGLKTAYLKTLRDVDTIKDALTHYIAPEGQQSAYATERFALMDHIEAFFQSDKKVLLLLGEAGSGKSTFGRYLARTLWEAYSTGTHADTPIPLFIALAEYPPSGADLIEHYLQQQGFKPETIDALRAHQSFIFILDGFDEIQDRNQAIYTQSKLDRWNAQVIISARPEYLEEGYSAQFQKRGQFNALQECWISSISDTWAEHYMHKYVEHAAPAEWDVARYQATLHALPTLKEAIRRPFLLRMALEIVPTLSTDNQAAPITRIALYDQFISLWWGRSQERLQHIDLTQEEKKAFTKLNAHFSGKGVRASQNMALALTKAKIIHAVYDAENERVSPEGWRPYLDTPTEEARLLLFNAPLIRNSQHYRFIHKSIQDYLVARAVCGPTFQDFDPITHPDAVLNQLSLVEEPLVLDFLVERLEQHPAFAKHLHAWIEASKNPDAPVTIGAANAITILVRAGVSFNGADLRRIRVPGADLSFGAFDSAQLQDADLSNTALHAIWLRQADLRGAKMEGARFGEWPFIQEDSEVITCIYSPDGRTCAIGLRNGTISVYATSNWEKITTLAGHTSRITSVVYSPSGQQIASGSADKMVRLWDEQTGQLRHTLAGHTDWVTSVVYSPSGQQIASCSDDQTVRLWNAQTGQLCHTLASHTHWVTSVVYSPNGQQLASGSMDQTVRLWDAQTGQLSHTLAGHTSSVERVVYSPSGQQIASGSGDKTIRLWDAQTGQLRHTLAGHTGKITSVVYSPSGQQIASGSMDQTVRLWDAQTGQHRYTLAGHTDTVTSVVYSPSGQQIASRSNDKTVRLWDAQQTRQHRYTLAGHTDTVTSVVYSPSGQQIASGSGDKMVRLWDAQTGQLRHTLAGHTGKITSVVYSPSGQQIASGSNDQIVRLWDAQQTRQHRYTLAGHTDTVTSVVYSPSGQQIASCSDDQTVRLWNAQTGQFSYTLTGHTDSVRSAVYSPSGQQIASCSDDQTVRLWDAQTGQLRHTLYAHGSEVNSVVYSPSGQQIASGGRDQTVWLWDAQTGQLRHALMGHTGSVYEVVYSPSGQQIASGSSDHTVRLWDAASGQCVAVVQGVGGQVTSLDWKVSPDGTYLVTGCVDKSVRVWQVIEAQGSYQVRLCWSSMYDRLTVTNTAIQGVQGLSLVNAQLLQQRGAVGEPSYLA